ncbi:MAG: DUF6122 family protein [Flavobacteriaceae bacterium]|jgi:hypothetical protein|nr:DUF6122 family protein [Flavobacteriaceae bacterium]MDG1962377.1 DUF6122 family protein [Flavobacteriaceae bacterium]
MMVFLLHYGIHFVVPIGIAYWFYKTKFWPVLWIFWGGILIDLDHFLATPIFDPLRCSIFFHPLHDTGAIALYVLLLFFQPTRIFGMALCLHIIADTVDCLL